MSCCPPNASKYLAPDYSFVGTTHTLEDGVEFYATGNANSGKGLLLIPDIFGWNGGRTRNIADFFASQGVYVCVPKLLTPPPQGSGTDGDGFLTIDMSTFLQQIATFPYDTVLHPRISSVLSHMKAQGAQRVALLGFCWGGWTTCHMLSSLNNEIIQAHLGDITCCAIAHPSVHLEEYAFKRDTQALFDSVQKPLLLMPAKGDPDGYRVGGSFFESVRTRFPSSESDDYPTVDHGFVPRGDLADAEVKKEVDRALEKITDFFNKHW